MEGIQRRTVCLLLVVHSLAVGEVFALLLLRQGFPGLGVPGRFFPKAVINNGASDNEEQDPGCDANDDDYRRRG